MIDTLILCVTFVWDGLATSPHYSLNLFFFYCKSNKSQLKELPQLAIVFIEISWVYVFVFFYCFVLVCFLFLFKDATHFTPYFWLNFSQMRLTNNAYFAFTWKTVDNDTNKYFKNTEAKEYLLFRRMDFVLSMFE